MTRTVVAAAVAAAAGGAGVAARVYDTMHDKKVYDTEYDTDGAEVVRRLVVHTGLGEGLRAEGSMQDHGAQ
jgi:hypothetical protein